MRSLIAGVLALILPMTECAGIDNGEGTPTEAPTTTATESPPDGGDLASTLQNFDDCDALLAHIRAEALSRVGPYGLDGDRFGPVFGAPRRRRGGRRGRVRSGRHCCRRARCRLRRRRRCGRT